MRLVYICSIAITLLLLAACSQPSTIADLAYRRGQEPRRIFIEENGVLTPYLVLTNNYNGSGHSLLLREYLMDERRRFNPQRRYSSYYEDSELDVFLNTEFLESLSQAVRDIIVTSTIEITALESIGVGGKNTLFIERRVFLLSFGEVGGRNSRVILPEGEPLVFFPNSAARIAYLSDGQLGSWWLRTPNPAGRESATGVGINGNVAPSGISGGGYYFLNSVRPAFCLPGNTPITQEYLDGQLVFVLAPIPHP